MFSKGRFPLPVMKLTTGMCVGVTWPSFCHPVGKM